MKFKINSTYTNMYGGRHLLVLDPYTSRVNFINLSTGMVLYGEWLKIHDQNGTEIELDAEKHRALFEFEES